MLEATGGLETLVATHLGAAGLPVAIVDPRQVRDFARAVGRLAKTDALDAEVLAHFGEALKPEPRVLKSPEAHVLDGVLTRRRQLVGMLAAEKQHRHTAEPSLCRALISTSSG